MIKELSLTARSSQQTGHGLYRRIGGYDVIAAIVDERLRADPRFARFGMRRSIDSHRRSRQLLVDQICSLAGGPCFYTGRDMKTAHEGLAITELEWEINMQVTEAVLKSHNIAEAERSEFVIVHSLQSRNCGDPGSVGVHKWFAQLLVDSSCGDPISFMRALKSYDEP